MALVSVREIFEQAHAGGYAVGGFDGEHLYMIKAILEAAEECASPVVVFLWEKDIEAAGPGNLENIVDFMARRVTVPVAIMLDHGTSPQSCARAMLNGHSGVMIDGSHLSVTENIAITRRVVDMAQLLDVLVEGEVGTISRTFEDVGDYSEPPSFTDPDEAEFYVQESGVDALAVSIGTASGIYKETPILDFDLLRRVRARVQCYLVLHGGSCIPEEQIRRAVQEGIVSIRFATENRLAFFDTLEARRNELGRDFPDSRLLLTAAAEAAKQMIMSRMRHMGSAGRASTSYQR